MSVFSQNINFCAIRATVLRHFFSSLGFPPSCRQTFILKVFSPGQQKTHHQLQDPSDVEISKMFISETRKKNGQIRCVSAHSHCFRTYQKKVQDPEISLSPLHGKTQGPSPDVCGLAFPGGRPTSGTRMTASEPAPQQNLLLRTNFNSAKPTLGSLRRSGGP